MTFELTGILLRAADNQRSVTVTADTLETALAELASRYPEMHRVLLDNTGQLRKAHRLLINGELITRPDHGLRLSENDRIEFLTAIAGG